MLRAESWDAAPEREWELPRPRLALRPGLLITRLHGLPGYRARALRRAWLCHELGALVQALRRAHHRIVDVG